MNGVTILYQESKPCALSDIQIILMAVALGLVVISILLFLAANHSDSLDDALMTGALATIIIALIIMIATVVTVCIPSLYKQRTEYYVTISDEVNYKEFTERYEVLKTKGDIYIVEEKSNDLQEND